MSSSNGSPARRPEVSRGGFRLRAAIVMVNVEHPITAIGHRPTPSTGPRLERNPFMPARPRSFRPAFEALEARDVPATFLVTDFGDTVGATGTLRDALTRANNNPGLDEIRFSALGLTSV